MKIFDDDDDYEEYDEYEDFEYGEDDDDYDDEDDYEDDDEDDDEYAETNTTEVMPLEVSTSNPQVDFSDLVIKDLHIVLTTHKNPWPEEYTQNEKVMFLDKVLAYLQDRQLYEMCSDIQKVKNEVVNESSS